MFEVKTIKPDRILCPGDDDNLEGFVIYTYSDIKKNENVILYKPYHQIKNGEFLMCYPKPVYYEPNIYDEIIEKHITIMSLTKEEKNFFNSKYSKFNIAWKIKITGKKDYYWISEEERIKIKKLIGF